MLSKSSDWHSHLGKQLTARAKSILFLRHSSSTPRVDPQEMSLYLDQQLRGNKKTENVDLPTHW